MAKIVSNLAHAVQDATKLRFVHRVCRGGKRKVEVVEFGLKFIALEAVAEASLLCSMYCRAHSSSLAADLVGATKMSMVSVTSDLPSISLMRMR